MNPPTRRNGFLDFWKKQARALKIQALALYYARLATGLGNHMAALRVASRLPLIRRVKRHLLPTVTMGQRKRPVASQRNEFTKFVVQDELFNSFPGGLAVDKLMLVGCDLHDKTMLLKVAVGRAAALQRRHCRLFPAAPRR